MKLLLAFLKLHMHCLALFPRSGHRMVTFYKDYQIVLFNKVIIPYRRTYLQVGCECGKLFAQKDKDHVYKIDDPNTWNHDR